MSAKENRPVSEAHAADYSERADIEEIHAAIMREQQEPKDGNEPISLWLMTFFMLCLFGGGMYLMAFSGGFRADVFSIYQNSWFGPGGGATGQADAEPVELTLAEKGEKVFRQNCVACHGANGAGQPGVFPTLIGTHWVLGSEKRLAGILLHGLQGPIEVQGNVYNGAMPAWGPSLTDEDIAGVLTYIRSSWGNDADEIQPAQIAAAREIFADRSAPWTAPELLEIPEGTPLPGAEQAPAEGGASEGEAADGESAPEEAGDAGTPGDAGDGSPPANEDTTPAESPAESAAA